MSHVAEMVDTMADSEIGLGSDQNLKPVQPGSGAQAQQVDPKAFISQLLTSGSPVSFLLGIVLLIGMLWLSPKLDSIESLARTNEARLIKVESSLLDVSQVKVDLRERVVASAENSKAILRLEAQVCELLRRLDKLEAGR